MTDKRSCTLDVAIITHTPQGIDRVASMRLPHIDGVSYVVSWQDHRDTQVPDSLASRDDVKVIRFDRSGLSLNRNNSFRHCTSDIILCADDDLTYMPEGLTTIMNLFADNPDVDLATFICDRPLGTVVYPAESCRLSMPLPRNYSVASVEIAFRRATAGELGCHPQLGLGSASMHGGEDEVLLLSAIRRGLHCRFFPVTICRHPHLSTGSRLRLTDKNLRAMGCVIALTYPVTCLLRIPLKAYRVHSSRQSSLVKALWYLTSGALRAPWLFRDRRYLW
ncbi:MAG: glycosyltransferase [Duncaniella sp.]